MSWEAWTIIGLLILVIIVLVRNLAGPDTVLLGVLTVLMTLALIPDANLPTPAQIISGFGNEGLVTIAVLFVVTAGLERTGAMLLLTEPMLGRPRSVLGAQVRLMFPVAVLSAFLNNPPIVAMFMPGVSEWCKKTGLRPSKIFIPLSYAAIMGGSCTLIGTATNLVVFSSIDPSLQQHIGMFTISKLAVPVAVMGITFVILISPVLLPDRRRGDPVDVNHGSTPWRWLLSQIAQLTGSQSKLLVYVICRGYTSSRLNGMENVWWRWGPTRCFMDRIG